MALVITAILFILLYLPLFPHLVKDWIDTPDYSHGFLIPLLSLYFLWRKREELKKTAVSPAGLGVVFVLAGVVVYILGKIGYQLFLQYLSMLVVLFGFVYAEAGWKMAKKIFFSIAYLIFMIPPPDLVYTTVTFHLGLFSTKLAYFFIRLLGINAGREGNIINLPTCQLIVAAPCSGLRSLIVLMAASLAIGYIFQKSIAKRAALFISSIIIAVIMNTARLVATALFAHMLKATVVPQAIHDRAGIVATIVGFGILFFLNDLLAKKK